MTTDIDPTPLVFDIETTALDDAAQYLDPVTPAKNLKDPAKVQADIDARTEARNDKLALDPYTCRIVALGWWTEASGVCADCVNTDALEAHALSTFWDFARHRTMIGFYCRSFDLRVMVTRSRLLGVTAPDLDLGRYGKRSSIIDLHQELTFGDPSESGAMRRTLKRFAQRFGVPVDDDIDGRDIPALVAAGGWAGVRRHVESDVRLTRDLAARLGFLRVTAEEGK